MIGCFYLRDLTLILLLLESCFDSLLTVFADVHSDFPVGVGSADRNVRKDKTKLHWFASHEDHEKGQSEYLRLRSKQQILTKNPYSQSRPPVLKSEQWSLILDRLILYLLRIHSRWVHRGVVCWSLRPSGNWTVFREPKRDRILIMGNDKWLRDLDLCGPIHWRFESGTKVCKIDDGRQIATLNIGLWSINDIEKIKV